MLTSVLASTVMASQSLKTEVTVYNQGMGLVKEVRAVDLKAGEQNVVIEDVAQLIDPTSVGFRCLNNPGSVSVLEQNYQFDLISPGAILSKSVGKKIRLTRTAGNTKEVVEGVLLSSPSQVVSLGAGESAPHHYPGLVLRTTDGRILLSPTGEIEVTEIPDGLISVPSLLWQLESNKAQKAEMELSYITRGMSWEANYVLTLTGEGTGDIQGWVSLDNRSGRSFNQATLKFLAGDVNTVEREAKLVSPPMEALAADARRPAMKQESLFEYHLYTLERPASIRNNEKKQLALLDGFGIPIKKQIVFDSMAGFDGYEPIAEGAAGVGDLQPVVKVKFTNNKESNLGAPMPGGVVRIYQRDRSGSVQLLGEDRINHTPTDEKIALTVGKAFDIRASRKRTAYAVLSRRRYLESFEIEVRNRKKEAENVVLIERFWGDWKITARNTEFVKEDANTAVFSVKLAAGETKTIKYTVETKF